MMRWLAIGLLVSAAVWGALVYWGPETRQVRLIHEGGSDMFCDFRMPRQCAQADNPYRAETVDKKDRCYPITGYVLAALFPEDFFRGGLIFTLAGWLAFVFAVGLALSVSGNRDGWWLLAAMGVTGPALGNVDTANQIWLAAAGVLVFLSLHGSERRWQRQVALFALALAAALKVTPGAFALILLKERRWRDFLIFAAEGAVLVLVPFLWWTGFGGIVDWLDCMKEHASWYGQFKTWGPIRLVNTVCTRLYGVKLSKMPALLAVGRTADLLLGAVLLIRFWKTRSRQSEILMLAAIIVMVPSVAQYYTLLYFVPVLAFAAGEGISKVEALLWLIVFCPLQIPLGDGAMNQSLANLALLALILRDFFGKIFVRNHVLPQ